MLRRDVQWVVSIHPQPNKVQKIFLIGICMALVLLAGCSSNTLSDIAQGLEKINTKFQGKNLTANQTDTIYSNTSENLTINTGPEWIKITFLNVGQGDSILLQTEGHNMLIDCGKYSNAYLKLKERGIVSLDYLVITHADFDHLGGCDDVMDNIYIGTLIMNGQAKDTNAYQEVINRMIPLIAQKNQKLNDFGAEFIHANIGAEESNMNSIVTRVNVTGIIVLLTADCDRECEDQLLMEDIDSHIIQVPHHGSKYGTSLTFLGRTTPIGAIISVGDNSYGHPSSETMTRLIVDYNVNIFRTDFNGDITITINQSGYRITTER